MKRIVHTWLSLCLAFALCIVTVIAPALAGAEDAEPVSPDEMATAIVCQSAPLLEGAIQVPEDVALENDEITEADAEVEAAASDLPVDSTEVTAAATSEAIEAEQYLVSDVTDGFSAEEADTSGQDGDEALTGSGQTLALGLLSISHSEIKLGQSISGSIQSEGAANVTWCAEREDGESESGQVIDGSFTWKPKATGKYLIIVIAENGTEEACASKALTVRNGALKAAASTDMRYAVANRKAIQCKLAVEGGIEPLDVCITVEVNGVTAQKSHELVESFEYMPLETGDHTIRLDVTDAENKTAHAEITIPVSSGIAENRADWEARLPSIDPQSDFAHRLVRIARSQVGYTESTTNFVIGDDGKVDGYTRYGDWYGSDYEEWCAMFVAFCLHYAGIPKTAIPRHGNNQRWKLSLGERYIDDEDAYMPHAGDIIFFHHNRAGSSTEPNFPNHVGIVSDVRNGVVYTIEGNSAKSVRERWYYRDDAHIVGYLSMRQVMLECDPMFKLKTEVTFDKPEDVSVIIDGESIESDAPIYAINGRFAFKLSCPEGFEPETVQVDGKPITAQRDGTYSLDQILDDRISITIKTHATAIGTDADT